MRVATNPSERKLVADVAEHGWHVLLVTADVAGPNFAFTVGLFHSYGHAEVIIFGLPHEAAHSLLNGIGMAVKSGQRFLAGTQSDQFLLGYPVAFVPFATSAYGNYFGYARWFYSGDGFPAVQCVWPDAQGIFPWDTRASKSFKDLQPMPGHVSSMGVQ
jgi:hypothetical protein